MRQKVCVLGMVMLFSVTVFTAWLMLGGSAAAQDGSCLYCGMKQAKFGHSWVVIEHEDGTKEGVCSVHCAAIDMALHTHLPIKAITVGDYNSKQQIDVDKAFWVIGGDQMGVMTIRAKWAFDSKASADGFIAAHGGRPATFDEVMKAAFEDMYADTLMIQKKRQMMKMKK